MPTNDFTYKSGIPVVLDQTVGAYLLFDSGMAILDNIATQSFIKTISLTGLTSYNLTVTNQSTGAIGDIACASIIFSGTPGATVNIQLPLQEGSLIAWIAKAGLTVVNNTGQSLVFKADPAGSTVTVITGSKSTVFCDGTNMYSTATSGTLSGLTDVVITSLTANQAPVWDTGTSKWTNQTVALASNTLTIGNKTFSNSNNYYMRDNIFSRIEFFADPANYINFALGNTVGQQIWTFPSGSGTFLGLSNTQSPINKSYFGGTNQFDVSSAKFAIWSPSFGGERVVFDTSLLTSNRTLTFPNSNGTIATTSLTLGDFAATTSAQLRGVLSDETGTGAAVFNDTPTLVTPVLGIATATSINKVAITAPATGSTLTVADGRTLTASNTVTFAGTDGSTVAYGIGGTVAYTANNLSIFASTTSAQLATLISDETGSGSLVFGTTPTITTPVVLVADTATNTDSAAAVLRHSLSSGTAANNIGTRLEFETQAADASIPRSADIRAVWTDATTKTSSLGFYTRASAGAMTQVLLLSNSQAVVSGTLQSTHLQGTSGTPTIVAGAGAGTGPTVSITGNDSCMQVTVTTGTVPTGAGATVATVTYDAAFAATPHPVYSDANGNAALLSGASMVSMDGASTTTFTIIAGTTGLTAATIYKWNVISVG